MRYEVTNPLMRTREEAENILRELDNYIENYGCVRVKDMYDMVFMLDTLRGDEDDIYGWVDLREADIEWDEYHGAYEICLPSAMLITPVAISSNCVIRQPKTVAEITICGAVHLRIDDTMEFIKPTPEQIKNLHDMLCIDVKLYEEE